MEPGRDYFTENFFSLVILCVYVLFCWKKMTAVEVRHEAVKISSVMNHFSIILVLVLAGLLFLMQTERMLYRIRNYGDITEKADEWWCSSNNIRKHILTIKLVIHVFLLLFVQV